MPVNLPPQFADNMRRMLGEEAFRAYACAMRRPPVTSVRLNPFKAAQAGLAVGAEINGFDAPVPWAPHEGAYLNERPPFTFDPMFHAGAYYVQEASSMFLRHALKGLDRPVRALDLCAAPGGKSTQLRSLLPEGSILVANEVVRQRASVLAQNLTRWGHADVVVTNSGAGDFAALPAFFDLIVADVPCSGEGMFRKDADAAAQWSPDLLRMCAGRQRKIAEAVWPSLKPGGLFVYSTCTFNTFENEANVKWIEDALGAEAVPAGAPEAWGVMLGEGGCCRFVPGLVRGEGFFLAVLRKKGEAEPVGALRGRRGVRRKTGVVPSSCRTWLRNADEFTFLSCGSAVYAVRAAFVDDVERLRGAVRVMQAGIKVCEVRGKDVVPCHALALSSDFNRASFGEMEVSYEEAVAYLCKKTLMARIGTAKGFLTVNYAGIPLGFVKNLGSRVNNLYPLECKIRTSYLTNYKLRADL